MTVKLPDELAARVTAKAARNGVSKSAVIRESIERELADDASNDQPSFYDLVKEDCGCFDSGVTDLATNPKYLEGFGK